MSSGSETSRELPSDAKIEQAIRRVIVDRYKSGNLEDLTVKRVRKAVEQGLDLPEDHLKTDLKWKEKSKEIILHEVKAQEAPKAASSSSTKQSVGRGSATSGKSSTRAKAAAPKSKKTDTTKSNFEGASTESKAAPTKRRKVAVASESDSELSNPGSGAQSHATLPSEEEVEAPANYAVQTSQKKPRDVAASEDENEKVQQKQAGEQDDEEISPAKLSAGAQRNKDDRDAQSESELSSVIDEAPAPKQKRQKQTAARNPPKGEKSKASKVKPDQHLGPQDAEIRRLQGWLVKCGIRKLWHKELARYDTPRAKISHLKEMLKDVGMEGRYSAEKAKQIKEQRELAADLEAVQEGAKKWGQTESDDEADGQKPRRRLAKGLKDLDFLGNDDGEETD